MVIIVPYLKRHHSAVLHLYLIISNQQKTYSIMIKIIYVYTILSNSICRHNLKQIVSGHVWTRTQPIQVTATTKYCTLHHKQNVYIYMKKYVHV